MNWSLDLPSFVQGVIQPKSFFLTEFDPGVVRALTIRLNEAVNLGQEIFPIFIESGGGDVSSLHAILSTIISAKNKGIKISTVTAGEASSAAAFIFCLGDEGLRFMGEHARIMIHGYQASSISDARVSEHKELFSEILKEEQETLRFISSHLKGNRQKDWLRKELDKRKDTDWFINAQEALELGITNHIGLPTFCLKLIPEISVSL